MVIAQRCNNVVKVTYLLQCCHNIDLQRNCYVVKLRNWGMCRSYADVKTEIT